VRPVGRSAVSQLSWEALASSSSFLGPGPPCSYRHIEVRSKYTTSVFLVTGGPGHSGARQRSRGPQDPSILTAPAQRGSARSARFCTFAQKYKSAKIGRAASNRQQRTKLLVINCLQLFQFLHTLLRKSALFAVRRTIVQKKCCFCCKTAKNSTFLHFWPNYAPTAVSFSTHA